MLDNFLKKKKKKEVGKTNKQAKMCLMALKYNQYSGQDLKTKHIEVIWIVAGIFFLSVILAIRKQKL